MPIQRRLSVVFNYRKIGRYALNALAGVLEQSGLSRHVEWAFPKGEPALAREVAKALESADRVLVLWSFYSPSFAENVAELQRLRQSVDGERVIHVAGGVHATAEPAQVLAAGFDLAAVGEGESIIRDLVTDLAGGGDGRSVRGIASVDGDELRRNGRGELWELDDCPAYPLQRRMFGPIEITRGCVFACSFCQTPFVNQARFRHRTVADTMRYVQAIVDAGMRDIRFITPTSFSYGSADESVNLAAIEELLSTVRKAIGPSRRLWYGTFPSEIRPEHVSADGLQLIRRYCDNSNVIIGAQSGSQRILDAIHRGHSVEATRRAVAIAVENGFIPNVDFLFGLPGETDADRHASRSFAEELVAMGARIHTHTFMPLPGTPLKASGAGSVDPATRQTLKTLEGTGRAYGQWEHQARKARELESLRSGEQE